MTTEAVNPSTQLSTVKPVDPSQSQVSMYHTNLSQEQRDQIRKSNAANTNAWELMMARLAIVQPQSPEVTGNLPGFEAGQIMDSISREIYSDFGPAPWLKGKIADESKIPRLHYCMVVPISKLPCEYIKWIPKAEQKPGADAWEWKTLKGPQEDLRVREGVWKGQGGTFEGPKPPVTTNINVLCLVVDPATGHAKSSYIVLTFQRTSFRAGQNFVTFLSRHEMQNLDYWGRAYWLWTQAESGMVGNTKSNWCEYHTLPGPRTDSLNPNIFGFCEVIANSLADPAEGQARQEMLINRADFNIQASGGETTDDKKPTSADTDPFAGQKEGQKEGEKKEQF